MSDDTRERGTPVLLPKSFLKAVEDARIERGMEKQELAVAAGWSPASYTRFLQNKTTDQVALDIARTLAIKPPMFLPPSTDPELVEWLEAGRRYREKDPKRFKSMLAAIFRAVAPERELEQLVARLEDGESSDD